MNNNFGIFSYLKPEDNCKLSSFNMYDINEVLFYINLYFLEYRDSLGLSKDVTFGLELECEDIFSYDLIKDEFASFKLFNNWEVTYDVTLSYGCEVKSQVMSDTKLKWKALKKACGILNDYGKIGENCAAHVHIGSHIIGSDKDIWLNFIKLWSSYEDIIFRFCYGEYLTNRDCINTYSKMLAYKLKSRFNKLDKPYILAILRSYFGERNQSINFHNISNPDEYGVKNTIEFRCANGTLNPIIWQNNVNLFVHLIEYSKRHDFDERIVSSRFREITRESVTLCNYKKIHLNKAIELADMIFDKNIDKVYFLRQYMKNMEVGKNAFEVAKPFTMSMKK